jgi:chorismate synthase
LKTGQNETLTIKGRHDPCIGLRALPVVESAVALGLLDLFLDEQP